LGDARSDSRGHGHGHGDRDRDRDATSDERPGRQDDPTQDISRLLAG